MTQTPLYMIGGPTASGKSAKALDLAASCDGVIVNADAMQVYQGLPLLTAQPSVDDKNKVPHYLYEVFDPSMPSSVATWLAAVKSLLMDFAKAGRPVILVGGTGLYFKALEEGLAEMPEISTTTRAQSAAFFDTAPREDFIHALAALDPVSAQRLKPNDRQRLIRAYEVVMETGKPIGFWQSRTEKWNGIEMFHVKHIPILPDRIVLYSQCDARFESMMARGVLNEVAAFRRRALPENLPVHKVIGLRELSAYQDGVLSLKEALAQAKQATRNYAKRQVTWFKNQWQINPQPDL